MKVCTDACLFGAWITACLQHKKILPKNILDIGTGTGLLSLMLAQKTSATIDAIEIQSAAAVQAKENFDASPWKDRLSVFSADILHYNVQTKYELIIVNPPFFEDDLLSADANKNMAKHAGSLSLQELIKIIARHLSEDGLAAVLLPYHRSAFFETKALAQRLFTIEKLLVKQTPKHLPFRTMLLCSKKEKTLQQSSIIIHNNERQYSSEFIALLKDYYLKL